MCLFESVSERGCVCVHMYLFIYNIKSVYVSMSEKSSESKGEILI